ncbi:CASTOR [Symbiodinium microadriaticum]|nr:CASTOR [Symbiodinium microadriaticum]
MCDPNNVKVAQTILKQARGIVARQLVRRMLVLRSLVPSVGYVYLALTSFKGDSNLLFVPAPAVVVGLKFQDVARFFPDAVICHLAAIFPKRDHRSTDETLRWDQKC